MRKTRLADLVLLAAAVLLLPPVAGGEGIEEWVARFDGPVSSADFGTSLALGPDGCVHVTGRCYTGAGSRSPLETGVDYVTIKYNEQGHELWMTRYWGPQAVDAYDEPAAIAVDDEGSVYVTGASASGPGARYGETWDIATVKYNRDGEEQWVARYDGPAKDRDEAVAIVLDAARNVYVTGMSQGVGTQDDFVTIKYGPGGSEEWVARYDGPAGNSDWARGIAVDADGNVYVAGCSMSSTHHDCATVKYDPDGNEVWVVRYTSEGENWDEANAMALDDSGNVFVTGNAWGGNPGGGGTYRDYLTVKYDPSGDERWVSTYNGPGYGSHDSARDIAVDPAGRVVVTGMSEGEYTSYDYATVVYGPDGVEQWVERYDSGGMGGHVIDRARRVALDGDGCIYVAGSTGYSESSDFTTIKYGPDGGTEWLCEHDGPAGAGDYLWDLAVGADGSAYVTGAASDSLTSSDVTTIRYVTTTAVEPDEQMESVAVLRTPGPNPFTRETTVRFETPAGVDAARLSVYDVAGRLVRTLFNGPAAPRGRAVSWDGVDRRGRPCASGVYFVRLEAGGEHSERRVVLLR